MPTTARRLLTWDNWNDRTDDEKLQFDRSLMDAYYRDRNKTAQSWWDWFFFWADLPEWIKPIDFETHSFGGDDLPQMRAWAEAFIVAHFKGSRSVAVKCSCGCGWDMTLTPGPDMMTFDAVEGDETHWVDKNNPDRHNLRLQRHTCNSGRRGRADNYEKQRAQRRASIRKRLINGAPSRSSRTRPASSPGPTRACMCWGSRRCAAAARRERWGWGWASVNATRHAAAMGAVS